jgi:hypothetical protein
VLENLECILLNSKNIVLFSIEDIKKSIRFRDEQTSVIVRANKIIIEINAKAKLCSKYSHRFSDEEPLLPFDRLMKYNDVTL